MVLALAIPAGGIAAEAQGAAGQPARRTVEKLEAGIAFWHDADSVGLPGVISASDTGYRWGVRVRRLVCQSGAANVLCSYEAKPCFDGPGGTDSPMWCARERRFERGGGFNQADGWIVTASSKSGGGGR